MEHNEALRPTRRRGFSRRRLLSAGGAVAAGVTLAGMRPAAVLAATRPASSAAAQGPAAAALTDVAEAAGRTVAAGLRADGTAALWTRRGAGAWAEAAFPDAASAAVAAVSGGPAGFVAAGSVAASGVERPACWHSPDGTRWARGVVSGGGRPGRLVAVAAGPRGALAVGCLLDADAAEGERPLVVSSPDGRGWRVQPTTGLPALGEGALTAVAHDGSRWVVAGVHLTSSTLWTSTDAHRWLPAAAPVEPGSPVVVSGLSAGSSGLTAIGSSVLDARPRLWTAAGAGWRPLALPTALTDRAGAALHGVSATPAGILVAGRVGEAGALVTVEG